MAARLVVTEGGASVRVNYVRGNHNAYPPARPSILRALGALLDLRGHGVETLVGWIVRLDENGCWATRPWGSGADRFPWRVRSPGEAWEALAVARLLPGHGAARGWTELLSPECDVPFCAPVATGDGHSPRCPHRGLAGPHTGRYAPLESPWPSRVEHLAAWAGMGEAVAGFEERALEAADALAHLGAPAPSGRVLWRTAEEAHRFVWEDGDVALSLGGVLFDLAKHARGGRHPMETGADSAPRDRYRRAAAGLFDAGVVLSEILADGAVVLTAPPVGDGGLWIR